MIEYTDITLIEAEGRFDYVADLMVQPTWMIRTNILVSGDMYASFFTLHLWHDGRIVIMDTNRPMSIEHSDGDLRELKEWSESNGWRGLEVNRLLLQDPRAYDFWSHCYRAGMVHSDEIKQEESEEMERFAKAKLVEESEEE